MFNVSYHPHHCWDDSSNWSELRAQVTSQLTLDPCEIFLPRPVCLRPDVSHCFPDVSLTAHISLCHVAEPKKEAYLT
jgi:hypothetical protein